MNIKVNLLKFAHNLKNYRIKISEQLVKTLQVKVGVFSKIDKDISTAINQVGAVEVTFDGLNFEPAMRGDIFLNHMAHKLDIGILEPIFARAASRNKKASKFNVAPKKRIPVFSINKETDRLEMDDLDKGLFWTSKQIYDGLIQSGIEINSNEHNFKLQLRGLFRDYINQHFPEGFIFHDEITTWWSYQMLAEQGNLNPETALSEFHETTEIDNETKEAYINQYTDLIDLYFELGEVVKVGCSAASGNPHHWYIKGEAFSQNNIISDFITKKTEQISKPKTKPSISPLLKKREESLAKGPTCSPECKIVFTLIDAAQKQIDEDLEKFEKLKDPFMKHSITKISALSPDEQLRVLHKLALLIDKDSSFKNIIEQILTANTQILSEGDIKLKAELSEALSNDMELALLVMSL